jgi:hypothetical protein
MAAEDHKQEAAEKANRAGRQFKHAASNAADAAEASAHVAKDEIVEHGEEAAEKAKNVIAALVNAEYTQAALAIGLGADVGRHRRQEDPERPAHQQPHPREHGAGAMKNFLLGLGLGVGLGYYFHDDITNALLQTAAKADEEKPAEPTS